MVQDVGCWREGAAAGLIRPLRTSSSSQTHPSPLQTVKARERGCLDLRRCGLARLHLVIAGGAEPEGTAATVVTPLPADRPSFSRGAHWRLARGAGAHWRLFCGQAGGCLMQPWPVSAVAGGRRDPGRPRAGGAVQNALARTELHFSVYGPSTGPFEKLDVLHSTVDVLHSTVPPQTLFHRSPSLHFHASRDLAAVAH